MRAIFGLVGILATLGVIVWLLAAPGGELDQIQQAKKVQDRTKLMVNDLSGLESNGQKKKSDPLTLEASPGEFRYVTLAAIDPAGSELAAKYGLQVGDRIVDVGPLAVGGASISTVDDAKLQLDVMREGATLTIRRNGQQVVLDPATPQPAATPVAATPNPATPAPAAPPPYQPPHKSNPNNPIGSQQLQDIVNAGKR